MNGIYHIKDNVALLLASVRGCQDGFTALNDIEFFTKCIKVQCVLQMLKRNDTSRLYDCHE